MSEPTAELNCERKPDCGAATGSEFGVEYSIEILTKEMKKSYVGYAKIERWDSMEKSCDDTIAKNLCDKLSKENPHMSFRVVKISSRVIHEKTPNYSYTPKTDV